MNGRFYIIRRCIWHLKNCGYAIVMQKIPHHEDIITDGLCPDCKAIADAEVEAMKAERERMQVSSRAGAGVSTSPDRDRPPRPPHFVREATQGGMQCKKPA